MKYNLLRFILFHKQTPFMFVIPLPSTIVNPACQTDVSCFGQICPQPNCFLAHEHTTNCQYWLSSFVAAVEVFSCWWERNGNHYWFCLIWQHFASHLYVYSTVALRRWGELRGTWSYSFPLLRVTSAWLQKAGLNLGPTWSWMAHGSTYSQIC